MNVGEIIAQVIKKTAQNGVYVCACVHACGVCVCVCVCMHVKGMCVVCACMGGMCADPCVGVCMHACVG